MGKGYPRGSRNAQKDMAGIARALVLPINAKVATITGASGVGWGTVVIGDIPEGNILLLGAVLNCVLTKSGSDIQATFDGDISIGAAPTADATLNGAEVNIIPSTSNGGAATAGVSPAIRGTNATAVVLDNTDGSLELNANVLVDDANVSGDTGTISITGTLFLAYIKLGDD